MAFAFCFGFVCRKEHEWNLFECLFSSKCWNEIKESIFLPWDLPITVTFAWWTMAARRMTFGCWMCCLFPETAWWWWALQNEHILIKYRCEIPLTHWHLPLRWVSRNFRNSPISRNSVRFCDHDSHGLTLIHEFEVRQTAMESLAVAVVGQTLDTDLCDENYRMDWKFKECN